MSNKALLMKAIKHDATTGALR
eukprot:COSAG02_NODE_13177_length_1431_cov_199.635886_1_plen_21_part_10